MCAAFGHIGAGGDMSVGRGAGGVPMFLVQRVEPNVQLVLGVAVRE